MIKVLKECGYEEAIFGLGLSFNVTDQDMIDYIPIESKKRIETVAHKLAGKGGGHNKFLESIIVWLYIDAPRSVWQEFDTYRVGMTKNSQSTMHTLLKDEIDSSLFATMELKENEEDFAIILEAYKRIHSRGNLWDSKMALPEGFIQGRQICTNYKTLQNVYRQRKNHRLKWWKKNLDDMLDQLEFSKFITA